MKELSRCIKNSIAMHTYMQAWCAATQNRPRGGFVLLRLFVWYRCTGCRSPDPFVIWYICRCTTNTQGSRSRSAFRSTCRGCSGRSSSSASLCCVCVSFSYLFLIPPRLPIGGQAFLKEVSESSRMEAAISLRHFDFVTNRFALGQNQSDLNPSCTRMQCSL